MTQETELLPCPFCGAPAFAHELEAHEHSTFLKALIPGMPDHSGSYVIEGSCECGSGLMADTREQVVMMWNRRAPDARDARIAELEAKIAATSPHDPGPAAIATLQGMGYEHRGGVLWAPPVGKAPSPATPWYPDDSGEWVEVPEDLREMPAELLPETIIVGLINHDRHKRLHTDFAGRAKSWMWAISPGLDGRIVAYKVVKP